LAPFAADVTVPVGHAMMGGLWRAVRIADPLEARGFVLCGGGRPIVFAAVDWCEIRNAALERWQTLLAEAAGTSPDRVLVVAVHQHDAPVADLEAEQLLRARNLRGSVCDPAFHERAVRNVAEAVRTALQTPHPITHIGVGQARVERVASNRRYALSDGTIRFDRMSSSSLPAAIAADEGLIDPWLKTLSFWQAERPLCAVSFYAVHPMSHYGRGEVSADFPGLARRLRQAEEPDVAQIYVSGCSGNVTAGKFNDGSPENRAVLAERLREAMAEAWRATRRLPLDKVDCRAAQVRFAPREDPGFAPADLERQLAPDREPFAQCRAALGLAWRRRVDAGRRIALPLIDFGAACLLVLPGEAYVEYQLLAQQMRPDAFVCVAGYGDGATGYIPTERHVAEGDANLRDWCWVAPGSEPRLQAAMAEALAAPAAAAP
jgi:hypothetical protein